MSDRTFFPLLLAQRGVAALHAEGSHFSSSQGEHHYFHHRIFSSVEGQIFVIELEDGQWLADSCAYNDEPKFATREDALRAAAQNVIQRVTWASTEWQRMPVEQANAIAEWAASVAKLPTPPKIEKSAPAPPKGQLGLFGGAA